MSSNSSSKGEERGSSDVKAFVPTENENHFDLEGEVHESELMRTVTQYTEYSLNTHHEETLTTPPDASGPPGPLQNTNSLQNRIRG